MITIGDSETYIFVIDTDKYAGNFEREMTAYMTGRVGQCGVGEEAAQQFYEEMGLLPEDWSWDGVSVVYSFEDLKCPFMFVTERQDEHGCSRPASIFPTPGWFNHGMGGHFREGEEEQAKADRRKECLEYANKKVHPNDQENHRKRWEERAEEPLTKHPAYQSVAIFMERRPSVEEVALLKERALAYAKQNDIPVTGFRLAKETVTVEEVEL